jgi:hypothetical protein
MTHAFDENARLRPSGARRPLLRRITGGQRPADGTPGLAAASGSRLSFDVLAAQFERAMTTLIVDLEPVAEAGRAIGFAPRMRSTEETLATEATLRAAAERLGQTSRLRRRSLEAAVAAFREAPAGALLFVSIHPSELVDGALRFRSVLAPIAERVVLQLRAGALASRDDSMRPRDGGLPVERLSEEFAELDKRR